MKRKKKHREDGRARGRLRGDVMIVLKALFILEKEKTFLRLSQV